MLSAGVSRRAQSGHACDDFHAGLRFGAEHFGVRAVGDPEAQLYGHDPADGIGGAGAMFLLLDEPEVYGLPPDPVVTSRDLPAMWKKAGLAALSFAAAAAVAFVGRSS